MRKIAVIPARKGSVGLPNKNLQKISELSLLDRTIKFVKELDINLSLIVQPCNSTALKQKDVKAEETNRQHQGLQYYPNGNLFGVRVGSFLKTQSFYGEKLGYILQEGKLNVDVNCMLDLEFAIQLENMDKL